MSPTSSQRRRTYLSVRCGRLARPGADRYADGVELARGCLGPPEERALFPPQLFLLWATTPWFQPYEALLEGIHAELSRTGLEHVPLIGSSVAACRFDGDVHEQGAVLICLASRFLEAKAALGEGAQDQPGQAVAGLLGELGLTEGGGAGGGGARFLIVFLPGYGADMGPATYRAPHILAALREQTWAKIPLFGGVSSGGLERGQGYQFHGRQVRTGSVVAALLQSHVSADVGLTRTDRLGDPIRTLRVQGVDDGNRRITRFVEGVPAAVLPELRQERLVLLEVNSPSNYPFLASPDPVGDQVRLHRPVHPQSTVQVIQPNPELMLAEVQQAQTRVRKRAGMENARMVGLLSISCVAVYRHRQRLGLDVREQERRARQRYPGIDFVGCYMDGEIGLDEFGRSLLGNWSVAQLLLADQLTARSHIILGFEALRKHTARATRARTVDEAVACVLACIRELGYPGGTVALLLRDRDADWLVSPGACCRADSGDVVARVLRGQHSPYIRDVSAHAGQGLFPAGSEGSRHVLALHNDRNEAVGALLIDLGDTRGEPALRSEQVDVLQALGEMAAAAINRAAQAEELALSRRLDEVVADWQKSVYEKERDAVEAFVGVAARAVGADMHVRLFVPGSDRLYLAGGRGPFIAADEQQGSEIGVTECALFEEVLDRRRALVLNDAQDDDDFRATLERLPEKLAAAAKQIGSLAILPITQEEWQGQRKKDEGQSRTEDGPASSVALLTSSFCAGFVVVYSPQAWYFTPARQAALAPVGPRLALLLDYVRGRRRELFLQEIAPTLDEQLNLLSALREQAEKLQEAAGAEVVSFYLRDEDRRGEDRRRHVLCAQVGWQRNETGRCPWLHAAWFGEDEPWLVELLRGGRPVYHLYTAGNKAEVGPARYHAQARGGPPAAGESYEIIALPLIFRGEPLGFVTLQRQRPRSRLKDDWDFFDLAGVLSRACPRLGTFVGAHLKNNEVQWRTAELNRQQVIDKVFLRNHSDLVDLLQDFCAEVRRVYEFKRCAVYLAEWGPERYPPAAHLLPLERKGLSQAPELAGEPPEVIDPNGGDECGRAFWEQARTVCRRTPPAADPNDPRQVRVEGQIERVCIRLETRGAALGVLDLYWLGRRPSGGTGMLHLHNQADLEELANRLTQAIITHHLRRERENDQYYLDGMAGFLLGNAHDMENQGRSVGVLLGKLGPLPAEQQALLEDAKGKVQELTRLLEEAHAHSRAQYEARPEVCPLEELVLEALKRHEKTIAEVGIEVVPPSPHGARVRVDRRHLVEVFSNGIFNAVKALKAADEQESKEIRLDLDVIERQERGYVPDSDEGGRRLYARVVIRDNGAGVDREKLERIQGRSSHARSGMGLFLGKRFCRKYGGDLFLESPGPGLGAALTILLPSADAPPGPAEPARPGGDHLSPASRSPAPRGE